MKKKSKQTLKHIAISPELHKQLILLKKTVGYHNMTETLMHIAISPELHKQLIALKKTGGYHNMTETIKSLIQGE